MFNCPTFWGQQPEVTPQLQQVESSLILFDKEKRHDAIKTALGIVFIVCLTIVIFTFIAAGSASFQ